MRRGETARLIQLLQSAQPMRLFRHCRYLPRGAVDEILALTSQPAAAQDERVAAVGAAVRRAKQAPLADGRRLPVRVIDDLLSRLGA
jgi:hypothetical protein